MSKAFSERSQWAEWAWKGASTPFLCRARGHQNVKIPTLFRVISRSLDDSEVITVRCVPSCLTLIADQLSTDLAWHTRPRPSVLLTGLRLCLWMSWPTGVYQQPCASGDLHPDECKFIWTSQPKGTCQQPFADGSCPPGVIKKTHKSQSQVACQCLWTRQRQGHVNTPTKVKAEVCAGDPGRVYVISPGELRAQVVWRDSKQPVSQVPLTLSLTQSKSN